jgi:hypothetical protein
MSSFDFQSEIMALREHIYILSKPQSSAQVGAEWVSGLNLRRLHSLYVCIFLFSLKKLIPEAPANPAFERV